MKINIESNDKLEDFKVFQLKFTDNDAENDSHSIYIKKYRSEKKSASKPVGKTVIVLNIPPYANEDSIKRVFSSAVGQVENVILIDSFANEHKTKYQVKSKFFNEKLPFKFLIGFIIFKKSSSVDTLLNLKNSLPSLSSENQVLTGVEKWTAEYNERIIDIDEMQKEIDEYMSHYDKVKQAENMNQGEEEGEADEDGWTTVGKKGNYAGFKQSEAVIHKLEQKINNQKTKAKEMLKKNYQQVTNRFYSFETRESKKQELIDLRKKFHEDKAKLQSMRQNRKFKPY